MVCRGIAWRGTRQGLPGPSPLRRSVRSQVEISGWASLFASCCHLREYAQRNNLLDHAQGLHIGFNAVIRQFVKRQTLLIQPAETPFVPKEWPILNVSDAFEQVLDRALQPDQDCTCLA